MAATTSGWQWPVETTAIPAEKSRNSLPSTSSTTTPRPLFTTSGYERVYEGEMYLSSPFRTSSALGPGSFVRILGPALEIVCVAMFILFSNRLWVNAFNPASTCDYQADSRVEEAKKRLVAGEEISACARRQHRQVAEWANQKIYPACQRALGSPHDKPYCARRVHMSWLLVT